MATSSIIKSDKQSTYQLSTNDFNTSYAPQIYDLFLVKQGKVVTLTGLIVLTSATVLPTQTTVKIGTIPEGYRPKNNVRAIGLTMAANWNNPGIIGKEGIALYVEPDGSINANRGGNTLSQTGIIFDIAWQTA